MQTAALLAYMLAAGLTAGGLVAAAAEIAAGRRLGLRAPFVARERLGRSLALIFAAGPFMFANEALAARRNGLIDWRGLALCLLASVAWAGMAGIVIVELVLAGASLLEQRAF